MPPTEFRAEPGHLYIVATPIGNLRDISLRALDILRSVDGVAAEDTRVSAQLLAAYGIEARLVACHEHNEAKVAEKLIARLQAGESIAYLSDAGTPGISDPGAVLVRAARAAGLPVTPLPGPSAASSAISVAGLTAPHWLFYGFLPTKSGARRQALVGLRDLPVALVFYEAPHRLAATLNDLATELDGARELLIARELTKRFESLHRCRLDAALDWLSADANHGRGEFVLVVDPPEVAPSADWSAARQLLQQLLAELPPSQAARLAARITGLKKQALYDVALTMSDKQTSDE